MLVQNTIFKDRPLARVIINNYTLVRHLRLFGTRQLPEKYNYFTLLRSLFNRTTAHNLSNRYR